MGDLRYGFQELPKIKERLKKMIDPGSLRASVSYVEGDIYRFLGDLETALPKKQQLVIPRVSISSNLSEIHRLLLGR